MYKENNYLITYEDFFSWCKEQGWDDKSSQSTAKNYLRRQANCYNMAMRKILITDESCCAKCGSMERLELDHIIPVWGGGLNQLDNLQILCKFCNTKKNRKIRFNMKNGEEYDPIPVSAFETLTQVVILYGNEEIPDEHDCDEMGCAQCHVKYRFRIPEQMLIKKLIN